MLITLISCFSILRWGSSLHFYLRLFDNLFWACSHCSDQADIQAKVNSHLNSISSLSTVILTAPSTDVVMILVFFMYRRRPNFALSSLIHFNQIPQTVSCFWEKSCVSVPEVINVLLSDFHSNLCFYEVQFPHDRFSNNIEQEICNKSV